MADDRGKVLKTARPATYLFRIAAAHVHACVRNSTPESAARALFDDTATNLVLRAASAPATTTTTGWAAELARLSITDTVAAIASLSAAADVINRGTMVGFNGFASIRIPGRIFTANYADAGQWVAEGSPIPVRQLNFTSGVTLQPHKVAVIIPFSREMAEASAIEQMSRSMVSEAVGLALDAAMFSNFAGDATRPPGLLANANIDSIAAIAGGGSNAVLGDIGNLFDSLSKYFAGKSVVFIAAPRLASTLKLTAGPHWDYPVISSAALEATKTLVALELASFVSAFGFTPEFDVTTGTTLHYEDTSPQNITGGTPSPAVPVRSLYQTDAIALRMVLRCSFGVRAAGHVQVVNGCTW
jgi:hypothetical protein